MHDTCTDHSKYSVIKDVLPVTYTVQLLTCRPTGVDMQTASLCAILDLRGVGRPRSATPPSSSPDLICLRTSVLRMRARVCTMSGQRRDRVARPTRCLYSNARLRTLHAVPAWSYRSTLANLIRQTKTGQFRSLFGTCWLYNEPRTPLARCVPRAAANSAWTKTKCCRPGYELHSL